MTRLASRRMQFVEIRRRGEHPSRRVGPYLNYDTPAAEHRGVVQQVLGQPWLKQDLSNLALTWASGHIVKDHFDEVSVRRTALVNKTLEAVHQRLTREINFWSKRANELAAEVKAGKQPRMQPANARSRVEELKARLDLRTKDLRHSSESPATPPPSTAAHLCSRRACSMRQRGAHPSSRRTPKRADRLSLRR